MMQLQFSVPDEVGERVKEAAAANGVSVSQYLAELVQARLEQGWPEGFFERVVGGWQGPLPERT